MKKISNNQSTCDDFKALYQNKCCDQENFDIFVSPKSNYNNNPNFNTPFLLKNFETKADLPCMLKQKEKSFTSETSRIGTDIYILDSWAKSVDKFSSSYNKWKTLPSKIDRRFSFCVTAFKQQLFVIGGSLNGWETTICLKYIVALDRWDKIKPMNEARRDAARR